MRNKTEQQILDGFRALRDVSPSESASDSAVRRALESVRADERASPPRLAPRKHWILRGSVAASVLLAAGLVWMSQSARQVSAAELLRQVIETADAYRGWVHIVYERDGKLPDPIHGVYPGWHCNKADGTFIVSGPNGIQMDMPPRGETAEYSSQTNEIRLGDMIPYNIGAIRRQTESIPIDIGSELANFRQATGREPLEMTRKREGDQERIQIRYFRSAGEAAATLKPIADYGSLPVVTTLWIDPRTRLIQRGATTHVTRFAENDIRPNHKPSQYHLFYGGPIADIYAAGAPRDAKVIDRRLAGDAKQMWDRLEKRHQQAYGDGISLVTSSDLLPDGRPDPTGDDVRVYMRQGAACFFGDYYIGVKPDSMGIPRIPPFADWPTPDLQEVLRRSRLAEPGMIFVTDGKRAWGGARTYARWMEPARLAWWTDEMRHSVSGQVWPTRWGMSLYGTGTAVETTRDPAHPERLTIHARQFSNTATAVLQKEVIHSLDTSRDDVPIRKLIRDYAEDGRTIEREYEYTYLDWTQLPNGRWYPTRWRQVNRINQKGSLVIESSFETHLRIFPGATIDSWWFTMPPAFPSPTTTRSAVNEP